jgi:glycerophosphoryl diester phosphodiesterase
VGDIAAAATSITVPDSGRTVLLKWHKLRQVAGDPPFSLANLRRGLAAGASLEIDARVLADGEWVCLHDDVLDEETDGSGPVERATAATIRGLRIAGGDFAPPLLADVVAAVAAAPTRGALLQIDLKQPLPGLTPAAIARFATLVKPVAASCLLSGTEWAAVARLGVVVPGLRLGFDPLDMDDHQAALAGARIASLTSAMLATAPKAATYYLNYRLVLTALDLGIDLIGPLHAAGATVDAWTMDPTTPGIERLLPRIVASGADQITTNDPIAMAQLWNQLSRPVG